MDQPPSYRIRVVQTISFCPFQHRDEYASFELIHPSLSATKTNPCMSYRNKCSFASRSTTIEELEKEPRFVSQINFA